MADIYTLSLQEKYQALLRVTTEELALGRDLTALTAADLQTVQYAADQAIFDWAMRRRDRRDRLRPNTNLQHLLDEYCAIADHI